MCFSLCFFTMAPQTGAPHMEKKSREEDSTSPKGERRNPNDVLVFCETGHEMSVLVGGNFCWFPFAVVVVLFVFTVAPQVHAWRIKVGKGRRALVGKERGKKPNDVQYHETGHEMPVPVCQFLLVYLLFFSPFCCCLFLQWCHKLVRSHMEKKSREGEESTEVHESERREEKME